MSAGSKWNTPFEVKEVNGIYFLHADNPEAREIMFKHCHNPYRVKVEAQKAALTCYNYWLLPENKTGSLSEFYSQLMANDEELQKLKGKNLMCGCDAEQYCHAELLLQIVN